MNNCLRMEEVHPDAPFPEKWQSTIPRECKIHLLNEMKNNREEFMERREMVRNSVQRAKAELRNKIGGIKSITVESKEKMDKAFKEFNEITEGSQSHIMELHENNHCKPSSLFLPEFDKEFVDEDCPYLKS